MSLGRRGPAVRRRFPRAARGPRSGVFVASAQTGSQSAVAGASVPRVRHRSEAVDVDRGQFVGRRLEDRPVVVNLDELAPASRRAASGRERRRLARFAEVCQDLPDRPRLADRKSAATGVAKSAKARIVSHSESSLKAISRMSPPQFGHARGNSSPTRAMRLAQAIRDVSREPGF